VIAAPTQAQTTDPFQSAPGAAAVPRAPLTSRPARPPPRPTEALPSPAPATPVLATVNLDHVRQFAAERGLLLPPDLRIIRPASDVPSDVSRFSGVWGGDERWNGFGRQVMVIVETVKSSGEAIVVKSEGPSPPAQRILPGPATMHRVPAMMQGNKLSFEASPGFNYTLTLYEDRRAFLVSYPNPAVSGHRGGSMWVSHLF
jgi:hypothetical protein